MFVLVRIFTGVVKNVCLCTWNVTSVVFCIVRNVGHMNL